MAAAAAPLAVGAEAISIGGAIFKSYYQNKSSNAQVDALRTMQTQARLQAAVQTNQRLSQVERVVSAQNAAVGARGIAPTSGSFSAVQSDTFNQAAEDQQIADINLQSKEAAISQDIENTEEQKRAQPYSNLFDVGADVARDTAWWAKK